MILDDLWGHSSFDEKFVSLWCWYSWKFVKRLVVKQQDVAEKDDIPN